MHRRARRRTRAPQLLLAALGLAIGPTACAPRSSIGAVAAPAPDALPHCDADTLPAPRFEPGTAHLAPEAAASLADLAACLRRPTHDPFHVVVVADPAAPLEVERAVTVRAHLAALGVPPAHVVARAPGAVAARATPFAGGDDRLILVTSRHLGPGCLTHMAEAPTPETVSTPRKEIPWSSPPPTI
ncbi:MAG: hypothetical protein H6704_15495 [Myxococcales bacterium]|nr:hypothetical protein [Myxococcales bacterium]